MSNQTDDRVPIKFLVSEINGQKIVECRHCKKPMLFCRESIYCINCIFDSFDDENEED